MKKVLILFTCLLVNISFSQVGINTKTPRKTLEVKGNTEIDGTIKIGTVNSIEDSEQFTFLMQENSGEIKTLDAANVSIGNALGYIQEFEIQNTYYDFIRDFDTKLNANDYTMIVTSFTFAKEVSFFSSTSYNEGFALPSVQAFIKNGTWHLKANYPTITTADEKKGQWNISTLIITKDLVKQFTQQPYNMNNQTTGSATNPILN